MKLTISILILVQIVTCISGENILFYFGSSGYSHRLSVWPIIEELASKGHNITFISPYVDKFPKPKNPLIHDLTIEGLSSSLGLLNLDFVSLRLQHGVSAIDDLWWFYYNGGINSCKFLLSNPQFQHWILSSSFQLIVLGALNNECGYGLAHIFQAPIIMYSSSAQYHWFNEAYGLPDENFPLVNTHYRKDANFLQRIKNLLVPLYWEIYRHWELFPTLEKLFRDNFPKNMKNLPLTSFSEIEKGTSLVIISQHFSEEYPRSIPPNFIYTGGIHCTDERKPLANDILDFINDAEDGFVFLSFGTYATLTTLPKYLQDIFLNSVAKFPKVKFIVKYNGDEPKGLSKNVKLVQWINQQDVVAHPKIRAFIGHGGLLGIQEAIYHGVPMIMMPLFAEQDYNAVRAHERETGISLEIEDLTEIKMTNAINNILNDKRYKENTMKLSKLFRDRPELPLDKAVWWIQYVLRHRNDTSHLLPVGVQRNWYQKRMLDIWGFLLFSFLISFSILWFLLKKIISGISTGTGNATKAKKLKSK